MAPHVGRASELERGVLPLVLGHLWYKIKLVTAYFPPFSLLHFVAIPVAVVALFRRGPERAVLAALYLGWLAEATVVQKEFDYAHAPTILLGLAVLAAHRWPVGPVFLALCVGGGLVHEFAGQSDWLARLYDRYPMDARMAVPAHCGGPSGSACGPAAGTTIRGS